MGENKENANGDGPSDESLYTDVRLRRQVRANYRNLENDIEENGEEIINPESDKLFNALKQTEDLFSKVRHPREAVHDSNVLLKLCRKGREQALQLKTDMISFDNHTFAEKLISYLNGRNIADIAANTGMEEGVYLQRSAWEKLGDRAAPLFKSSPKFDFLLGPLVIEVALPKERQARKKASGPSGEVVKLKQIEKVEEQEEATTKEVERIRKLLVKCTNKGETSICFFRFIINPSSFGQTIENLFHISFLIKDGKAIVEIDGDGLPILNIHKEYQEGQTEEIVTRKQVIMPLCIEDWEEIIKAYKITEPMIPTRGT